MDAYDRCNNLGKKIFPIVLPSVVEAENFQTTHVQRVWSSVAEQSVVFKSNIVNVRKPAVSFCGCQASNRKSTPTI